jgi:hypothetical protein
VLEVACFVGEFVMRAELMQFGQTAIHCHQFIEWGRRSIESRGVEKSGLGILPNMQSGSGSLRPSFFSCMGAIIVMP